MEFMMACFRCCGCENDLHQQLHDDIEQYINDPLHDTNSIMPLMDIPPYLVEWATSPQLQQYCNINKLMEIGDSPQDATHLKYLMDIRSLTSNFSPDVGSIICEFVFKRNLISRTLENHGKDPTGLLLMLTALHVSLQRDVSN
eukprot:30764_1